MLAFENPEVFSMLVLPPLFALIRKCRLFCRPDATRAGDIDFVPLDVARVGLSLILFVCLTAAAGGAVLKTQHKEYLSAAANIVFVVDTSPAMATKDIDGISRLDAVKAALEASAQDEWGARLALVEMGQEVRLLVPLTQDREEFLRALRGLKAGAMGAGCAIGDALVCSSRHIEKCSAPKKSVVLISCGENITGTIHPHTAAHLAQQQGVSLYVLGVGKKGIWPIEYEDPQTLSVIPGYIDSKFDSSALSDIAFQGGGIYFEAQASSLLHSALTTVRYSQPPQSYRVKTQSQDLSCPLLSLALICLLVLWCTQMLCPKEAL